MSHYIFNTISLTFPLVSLNHGQLPRTCPFYITANGGKLVDSFDSLNRCSTHVICNK